MGVFDALFGGTGDEIREAQREGEREIGDARAMSQARIGRSLANIDRTIERARVLGRSRDSFRRRATVRGARDRRRADRMRLLAASGLTGRDALSAVTTDDRVVAEALDAERSADLRRFVESNNMVGRLLVQRGDITVKGSQLDVNAAVQSARNRLEAASAITEARNKRTAAMLSAVGGAAGGFFTGGGLNLFMGAAGAAASEGDGG